MTRVGIVIVAHNEERTIGRLLAALADLAGDAETVVVCNGCTDATPVVAADVAPWARILELAEASKPAALRAGDRVVEPFPRLYLDADVVITGAGVRRLAAALADGELEAVAPTPRYDTAGSSSLVRAHYRVWTALQSESTGIHGTGAMMVSRSGRARFGDWPDVIADDFFLDGQFAPQHKARLADVEVIVRLPRRFGPCVSRRARVHQGNLDVVFAGLRPPLDGGRTARLAAVVRRQPRLVLDLPAHLIVTVSTRLVGWWRRRCGAAGRFHRDASSR